MKINLKTNKQTITEKQEQRGLEAQGRPRRCPESAGWMLAGEVEALSRSYAWACAQSHWLEQWGCLGMRHLVSGRGTGRC